MRILNEDTAGFKPLTITLQTQKEVDCIVGILHRASSDQIKELQCSQEFSDIYKGLFKYASRQL